MDSGDDLGEWLPGNTDHRAEVWDREMSFPLALPEEKVQIAGLREALGLDLSEAPCAAWRDVSGDTRLLRFLRGYDHNVQTAADAVRDMLTLRKERGVDDEHDKWAATPCENGAGFPNQTEIEALLPNLMTVGVSLQGHPITYIPVGRHDVRTVLSRHGEEEYLRYYLPVCESRMAQLDRLSEEQGKMVKLVVIMDLKGISLWHVTCRRWTRFERAHLDRINKTCAESLARFYCINSPWWIRSFYRKIEGLIPPNTRRKIQVLGEDYRPAMLEIMDAATLQSLLAYRDGHPEDNIDSATRGLCNQTNFNVPAGKVLERTVLVSPGDTVRWSWVVQKHDVDFEMKSYSASAEGEEGTASAALGLVENIIRPVTRFNAHEGSVEGHFLAPPSSQQIMFEFKWSNAHSWLRSKDLIITLEIVPSKNEDPQLTQ